MLAGRGGLSQSMRPRANRWRRWLPAAAISMALHLTIVPGVAHYVAGRFDATNPPPSQVQAELELERVLPKKPPEPIREILEPLDELPLAETSPLQLPPAPDLVLPPPAQRPRLAMNDIRFPESAFGEHLVPPHVETHPEGAGGEPSSGTPGATETALETADTSPLAPLFPADPPHEFLDGLPSAAVRLGEAHTVFGERAEAELRRRVYAHTYYPEAAADLNLEGVVIVGFRINADGEPRDLSVTNPEMCHPILQEEALAMVRSGAPYPVPESSREVEVSVALAYLNTPEGHAERIHMLLSSGADAVDQHARQMAAQDATLTPELGWHLALYQVRGKIILKPGEKMVTPRLDAFIGDPRLKRVFVESLPQLLPRNDDGTRLKIPIQFRILDP